MRKLTPSLAQRFGGESGVAAVEFAMILPILVLLFFGSMEAGELMTVKRRVVNSGNSLSDLFSHEPTILKADIDDAIIGAKRMLEPIDATAFDVRVVSVVSGANAGDPPRVHWSIDENGAAPYAAGANYTKLKSGTNVRSESSLVVVEVDFTYYSNIGGRVFTKPMTFTQIAKRWPRKSARVQLCLDANPTSCTS